MKAGIIGSLGHLHYLTQGRQLCEYLACAPGADEDMAAVTELFPTARPLGSAEELLELPGLEMVVVNTYANLNATYISRALARGIHVFSEKPLSSDLEGLAEVENALAHSSAQLSCMLALRGEGPFLAAKRAVEEGLVGQVRLISAQKSYKLGVRPAYYRRNELFGGLLPWVGIHGIDLMRYLSSLEYWSVTAQASSRGNGQNGELEVSSAAMFTLEEEAAAVMSADYLRPSGAPSHEDDRVRVAGTLGVVEVRDRVCTLIDAKGAVVLTQPEPVFILQSLWNRLRWARPRCAAAVTPWRQPGPPCLPSKALG